MLTGQPTSKPDEVFHRLVFCLALVFFIRLHVHRSWCLFQVVNQKHMQHPQLHVMGSYLSFASTNLCAQCTISTHLQLVGYSKDKE